MASARTDEHQQRKPLRSTAKRLRLKVDPESLPPGQYPGTWGGCLVEFATTTGTFEVETSTAVRGLGVPCIVTIQGGRLTVETAEPAQEFIGPTRGQTQSQTYPRGLKP